MSLLLPILAGWLALAPVVGRADDLSNAAARPAPDWLRRAVIYQIFPRNFSEEGTFDAITGRLDELDALGVDILWLMPIHPIGEKNRKGTFGSPYAVRDYRAVNPRLGTLADFKRLVREAHRRDLKVIIDVVANHTAWDSVLMEQPAFYKQNARGDILPPNEDWTDVAGLNYENPELRRYMIDMLNYWAKEVGVDGFRCDVAYLVPTDFWETARAELEQINPDILMLAEASAPELLLSAFDLDYAWPMHSALNDVLRHGAPATRLQRAWQESRERFPAGALHMRFSDNHDEARAIARFGMKGALAAQVIMMTLDGVPLLYNGMEVGDATESGAPALFEDLPIYWEPKERPPLRAIYSGLIRLRRDHAAFTGDQVIWLNNSEPASLVTFMRRDEATEFVVLVNLSNRPVVGSVEVMHPAEFRFLELPGTHPPPRPTFPLFELRDFEWRIYHRPVPR